MRIGFSGMLLNFSSPSLVGEGKYMARLLGWNMHWLVWNHSGPSREIVDKTLGGKTRAWIECVHMAN